MKEDAHLELRLVSAGGDQKKEALVKYPILNSRFKTTGIIVMKLSRILPLNLSDAWQVGPVCDMWGVPVDATKATDSNVQNMIRKDRIIEMCPTILREAEVKKKFDIVWTGYTKHAANTGNAAVVGELEANLRTTDDLLQSFQDLQTDLTRRQKKELKDSEIKEMTHDELSSVKW